MYGRNSRACLEMYQYVPGMSQERSGMVRGEAPGPAAVHAAARCSLPPDGVLKLEGFSEESSYLGISTE